MSRVCLYASLVSENSHVLSCHPRSLDMKDLALGLQCHWHTLSFLESRAYQIENQFKPKADMYYFLLGMTKHVQEGYSQDKQSLTLMNKDRIDIWMEEDADT